MQQYEDLKVLVAEIEADVNKAEGGNKAAGTRVRKQMQQIKQAAQAVRNEILAKRCASKIFKEIINSQSQDVFLVDNQYFDNDSLIDFVAAELKKDINSLIELGIKLDKGALVTKTGGAAWAGYEAFTGEWLSALVIGGISLLVGGLTNGYKRIKLMEMKQKWMDRFSELNEEQLEYLVAGLRKKYPVLLGRFQNLLQAGQ